jgi:hypothetical protein
MPTSPTNAIAIPVTLSPKCLPEPTTFPVITGDINATPEKIKTTNNDNAALSTLCTLSFLLNFLFAMHYTIILSLNN